MAKRHPAGTRLLLLLLFCGPSLFFYHYFAMITRKHAGECNAENYDFSSKCSSDRCICHPIFFFRESKEERAVCQPVYNPCVTNEIANGGNETMRDVIMKL